MTIYKCQQIIDQIELSAIENDGEISDEQMKSLVEANTTSIEKLGSLCGFMKYLEHGIDACKKEESRISEMRKKAEKRMGGVKKYLLPYVLDKGKVAIDTFTLSTRKSTSVSVAEDFVAKEYMREVITVSPDKLKIKEALQSGVNVEGACLQTNYSLQFK